jgi:hypothetical protein
VKGAALAAEGEKIEITASAMALMKNFLNNGLLLEGC